MSKRKSKMRKINKVKHAAASGELCLVGQIAFLLGGPALVARLWRWR